MCVSQHAFPLHLHLHKAGVGQLKTANGKKVNFEETPTPV